MRAQNCLYSVAEQDACGVRVRIIGSIQEYLHALENPQAVIERIASPLTRIVSLTITEGGYYVNQGSGGFDDRHPDIVHDLARPEDPICSFGYLAAAFDLRRQRGLPPFTIMSCDNLQQNGDTMKRMMLAFAELRDKKLWRWLAANGSFPNSMVDRITPATTEEHRTMIRTDFGVDDAWPVVTEPFRQWVIEDHFPNGRPAWERVGVQMTSDVLPYEKMKIRLLNASHQAICHIGRLLGYQYVHEAIAEPQIKRMIQTLMDDEVTPLLQPVSGIDLIQYKHSLIERLANPAIKDQLARIGMDGSARMPKFVLPSISEQLARGGPIDILCLTVACWFRCLGGMDDLGQEIPLDDPLSDILRDRARRGGMDPGLLLNIGELFGADLPRSRPFLDRVSAALRSLFRDGARATLSRYVSP
jgi:mannitol 2-dehydrogenase